MRTALRFLALAGLIGGIVAWRRFATPAPSILTHYEPIDEVRLRAQNARTTLLARRAAELVASMDPSDPSYAEAVHYRDALR